MNVYIPGGFATQGPCDSGFHVPSKDDWDSVINIWTSLGGTTTDGTDFGLYLKLPFAGNRHVDGAVYNQGTQGRYWYSICYSTGNAYSLIFSSSYFYTDAASPSSMAFSIRPFKDTPVVPTVSWTKLYGTSIESGGIFWNSTDGLISLSSDGTTWVTIADKNLGATSVWNNGDTLAESNCGKYYQWGNNYAFPRTGAVTTSSTQVDASAYGPGNYYNSSTFITNSNTWFTPVNYNLRGGVDGNVQVMSELKNAYIGEYIPPYLCFTANTAGSTVKLKVVYGTPTSVSLETSTDNVTWSSYTIGNTITLSNIGDKVYFRNSSETDTGFSIGDSGYYKFVMSGSIAGSGDVTTLLNKNGTTTLSDYCFYYLFYECTALTSIPTLPATILAGACYCNMFRNCTSLTTLPKLPATTLTADCYLCMFYDCSNIKLSTTQTGEYQTAYRIPTTGTGTTASDALYRMFRNTGGTFTGTPSINTTYYTSNTVV